MGVCVCVNVLSGLPLLQRESSQAYKQIEEYVYMFLIVNSVETYISSDNFQSCLLPQMQCESHHNSFTNESFTGQI